MYDTTLGNIYKAQHTFVLDLPDLTSGAVLHAVKLSEVVVDVMPCSKDTMVQLVRERAKRVNLRLH